MKYQNRKNNRQDGVTVHIADSAGKTQKVLQMTSGVEEVINHLLEMSGKKNIAVQIVALEESGFKLSPVEDRYFHVHEENHIRMVRFDDIVYLEAARCYCEIYQRNGKTITLSRPMSEIERHLPEDRFIRIHHSFILSREYLDDIFGNTINLPDGKTKLSISKKYRKSVYHSLNIINSQSKKFLE